MKLGYTILYVQDVPKTLAFYEKAFGLTRKMLHEDSYGELDTGSTTLSFASFEMAAFNGVSVEPTRTDAKAPAFELAFVTDDPQVAFKQAVASGALPIKEPAQKPWGQTVAYVRDLNGFLIEICTPVA